MTPFTGSQHRFTARVTLVFNIICYYICTAAAL
jgi:hypothetical protein